MNFEIGAKYSLDIFKNNGLSPSWNTIKVGWDLNLLTSKEISNFAIHYLEQHPNLVNEYISELILGVNEYEINNYLVKVFNSIALKVPEKGSAIWNKEWRKWRFCIISEMCKQIKNNEELLIKIDWVGASFGYPNDMKALIYYLPSENNIKNIIPENAYKRLVQKVYKFLKEEQIKIENGYDSIPQRID